LKGTVHERGLEGPVLHGQDEFDVFGPFEKDIPGRGILGIFPLRLLV
jgi:hypothetical protein